MDLQGCISNTPWPHRQTDPVISSGWIGRVPKREYTGATPGCHFTKSLAFPWQSNQKDSLRLLLLRWKVVNHTAADTHRVVGAGGLVNDKAPRCTKYAAAAFQLLNWCWYMVASAAELIYIGFSCMVGRELKILSSLPHVLFVHRSHGTGVADMPNKTTVHGWCQKTLLVIHYITGVQIHKHHNLQTHGRKGLSLSLFLCVWMKRNFEPTFSVYPLTGLLSLWREGSDSTVWWAVN